MLNEKLNAAFNNQINEELYSAYLYLSMQIYFKKINLMGFANWMDIQVQEEMAHAKGLLEYIQERDGEAILEVIKKPDLKWNSPLEAFKDVLKHEMYITSKISELADVADEVKDRAAALFLQWYVKEQVEEESNASGILSTLELIKDNANALLLLDRELAQRTFVQPVIG